MIKILVLTIVVIADASNHHPQHLRHRQQDQLDGRQGRSYALPAKKSSSLELLITSSSNSTPETVPLNREVFGTIRQHFQKIREAINKLEPLTTEADELSKNSTKSESAAKDMNITSAMMDWMSEITGLAIQLPIIHESVSIISQQIRALRDRMRDPNTVSVRDADGNLTLNIDDWITELDKIESEFRGISDSWDKMISNGVPLMSLYTSLDQSLKYQSPDISKQEDIYIPDSRLRSLLRSIAAARERLRKGLRQSLNRTLPGVEVNSRVILPGQNDTEEMSIEERRAKTRNQIREQTVDTVHALTTSVKLIRTNMGILSELYSKLLASYILNLTQVRISAGRPTGEGKVPSGVPGSTSASLRISGDRAKDSESSATAEDLPASADPFRDTQDNPYGSLNVVGVVTREVDQIVDLVSGIAQLG